MKGEKYIMKKLYNTPEAMVYNTLADRYCLEITGSVVPSDTNKEGYGNAAGEIDGSGLLD